MIFVLYYPIARPGPVIHCIQVIFCSGRSKKRKCILSGLIVLGLGTDWMKRIGIYHYQYFRGACKICYRHFINEMLLCYEECHKVAESIYGEGCEFFHYTDFGQYDSNDLDRPSFHRLEEALENNELDVVMCNVLNNITTNEKQLIAFYKRVRAKGLDFITAKHGLDAMKYIDLFIEKQENNS